MITARESAAISQRITMRAARMRDVRQEAATLALHASIGLGMAIAMWGDPKRRDEALEAAAARLLLAIETLTDGRNGDPASVGARVMAGVEGMATMGVRNRP